MAQNPASDLANTVKNAFGDPVGTARKVLNTVDSVVPKWLPGVSNPDEHQAPQNDTSYHDQQVKKANDSFGVKTPPAPPKKVGPTPKYHKGTDYVPKTGPAILKKGEAVLNTDDADKLRKAKGQTMSTSHAMKSVSEELGGKKEATPKKEIKHIITRKTANGKSHIHTHVHTHPAHPDEEHVTTGDDEMAEHMMQHMGTPNPGEAEADAGQGAAPGAAPVPGAAAAPAAAAPVPGAAA